MTDPTSNAGSFRATPQMIVGGLVAIWGLLLTAGNLGWIDRDIVYRLFRFWPLAIVALGVARITSAPSRSAQIFGGVILLAGLWLTASYSFGYHIHVWAWWPLLLVAAGVIIMLRARDSTASAERSARSREDGTVEIAFWSGIERRIAGKDFRGADLTAIMGGIELDLRGAETAAGEAVVDVFALMGGIEIVVPPDWAVVNRVRPFLGGVEDHSTGTQAARHRLVLRGFVIMGGVEVKT